MSNRATVGATCSHALREIDRFPERNNGIVDPRRSAVMELLYLDYCCTNVSVQREEQCIS